MAKVAREAFADTGANDFSSAIDTVAVVRFTADSPGDQGRLPKRMFRNPPLSLAKQLGIDAAPRVLHRDRRQHAAMAGQPHGGGNRARRMRGRAAGRRGIYRLAARRDEGRASISAGAAGPMHDPGSDPEEIGDMRPGTTEYERRYGLRFPGECLSAVRERAARAGGPHAGRSI